MLFYAKNWLESGSILFANFLDFNEVFPFQGLVDRHAACLGKHVKRKSAVWATSI